MVEVQLKEDEEQFAALVAKAEAGERITILRGAEPVAELIPVAKRVPPVMDEERKAAYDRLMKLMTEGVDLGGAWEGRAALYERD